MLAKAAFQSWSSFQTQMQLGSNQKRPPKSYYFLSVKIRLGHQWIIYPAFCPSEVHSVAKLIIR